MMIDLSKDELLVLFEFLHRFFETDKLAFSHHSEAVVLDRIDSLLESTLSEPFDDNYLVLLKAARDRILSEYESKMGKETYIHDQPLDQI